MYRKKLTNIYIYIPSGCDSLPSSWHQLTTMSYSKTNRRKKFPGSSKPEVRGTMGK